MQFLLEKVKMNILRYNECLLILLNLMSKKTHRLIDSIIIVLWVLVIGVVGLYWNVLMLEISYVRWENKETTMQSLVETTIWEVFSIKEEWDDIYMKWRVLWWSVFAHSMERELLHATKKLDTSFLLLPPWRYLRIPRLWIESPIVDVPFASPEKIETWDFDEELKQWVVKYPFTASPWKIGNTLLFGHSSVDTFEKADNPFWFVFYALPKLENWDRIELIRDWNLYEYEVQTKKIKRPSQVPDELNREYDAHQLTLMACYPLLSDAQRILIDAKLVAVNWLSPH